MSVFREAALKSRRLLFSLLNGEPFFRPEIRRARLRLGSSYGGFTIIPEYISDAIVFYSFGLGTDISFELACIEKFKMQVHAFDPTPKSLQWLRTQQLPPQLILHEYGVAGSDGSIAFYPPTDPTHISFSLVKRAGKECRCPVYRISTIMRMLGHDHIDLLKMDIEGAEYEVIEDIIRVGISVRQICVEFHHRWSEIGTAQTEAAIHHLRECGYRLFDVSASGEEFSFIWSK
jgi:FkbM family methyltransferase